MRHLFIDRLQWAESLYAMKRGQHHVLSIFVLIFILCASQLSAQPSDASDTRLSLDSIFLSKDFKVEPFAGRWQTDSQGFEWIRTDAESGATSIVQVSLINPKIENVLVPSDWLKPTPESKPLSIEAYEWSVDRSKLLLFTNTRRVWRVNSRGDFWLFDVPSHRLVKLGGDVPESSMMFAKFSPDATKVGYVFNQNIYLQDLADLAVTQLTFSGSPTLINGTFDWAYEEEFTIRDGFRFSPDGQRIAFWEIDSSGIGQFPLVDNTSTLYPAIQFIPYPKVGTTNPSARIGMLDLANHSTTWASVPGDRRDNYLPRMEWIDSEQLAVQQLNRAQNCLRIYTVDAETGDATAGLVDEDAAWVDVPNETVWTEDKSSFLWLSERSGWRHIYLVSRDGKTVQPVTQGQFDVIDLLGLDEALKTVYFYASPDNATQKYLYRIQTDGTGLQRVTPDHEIGTNQYVLSPDRRHALVTVSRFADPPRTDVVNLRDHSVVSVVEENRELVAKLADVGMAKHEFFRVDIGEGVELDAWSILPHDFDPAKEYPLIVFVYGEPAGQTVVDQWGGDRMLWHQYLAKSGYVVMSFDNRGTPSPRGRQWRKSVYRQIGILASSDQAAAVQSVLAKRPYLDAKRVGVWGWSGGGSMTLNLMFRSPDLYATGISIAPVPNQLYYDTIYQERYMGLPSDNADGYRLGSPITFASQLKGDLLLIHGTGDDNCHYQTSELLINELIKHDKLFSMFAYPNRSHAIREGENTTRHLYQTMTQHFFRTLPVTTVETIE